MNDNQLIKSALNGNENAKELIVKKHKNLVHSICHKYFIKGADKNDLIQEGMIGLWKAIINFKENNKNDFQEFAGLCIKRQVQTAISRANRKKHNPLNSAVSIYKSINDFSTLENLIFEIDEEIINNIIFKESLIKIKSSLSPLEKKVFNLRTLGYSYQEIAEELNISVKSIDNALTRIKEKIRKYLS